ncbi:aldehyde dehydrogenase family protein [Bacillus sp. JJ1533]|uniref:aldehyde dehydrogenase family protein n=1 Tax=Bacillus sp. JJ1533 TaxID=3122959 RepID=UPI003F68A7EB
MTVGGQWCGGSSSYELKSPYDNEVIGLVPSATPIDVDKAISSAAENAHVIANMTAYERAGILERVSTILERRTEEFAQTMAKENAKPIKAARSEITRAIQTYKFAAEEAKRLSGETIPLDAAKGVQNRFAYTKREPLGVIAAITPFNFPVNLVAHKLGPAIAGGNSVVLKPASQTPLTALLTAEAFEEAGLPPGVLNVVTGKGSVIGDVLVTDPRVKMVTFTGSLEVGLEIKKKAGLKRVTLELGSNAPVIVDSVTDLDKVAARCVEGAFSYAGQICISIQRIYVQKALYDSFLDKFEKYTKNLVIGNPLSENTDVSAMIHENDAIRISKWVNEAERNGATVVVGGNRDSSVFEPTILTNVSTDVSICCNEAFAPIVIINKYVDWEEAIAQVNNSQYGLQAGVFTTDLKKAFAAADSIQSGSVLINDVPTFRVDHMPYGGVKNSGIGKEGVRYSLEEMTELKLIAINIQ